MNYLAPGTRVYNGGDMANPDHFGTVIDTVTDEWGTYVWIKPDKGSAHGEDKYSVPICLFSDVYLGHGGTRFVTEAAYEHYRAKRMAEMKARMAH